MNNKKTIAAVIACLTLAGTCVAAPHGGRGYGPAPAPMHHRAPAPHYNPPPPPPPRHHVHHHHHHNGIIAAGAAVTGGLIGGIIGGILGR